MLRSFFLIVLSFFTVSMSAHAVDSVADELKPTAIVFYADWCGSCKILEPKFNEAVESLDGKESLNVIKFDLTDEKTKEETALLAEKLGLSNVYKKYAPKTGFVILIKNGQEVHKITKDQTVESIQETLKVLIVSE